MTMLQFRCKTMKRLILYGDTIMQRQNECITSQ